MDNSGSPGRARIELKHQGTNNLSFVCVVKCLSGNRMTENKTCETEGIKTGQDR